MDGALHGCIGTLYAVRAMVLDVVKNAYAAAFRDQRGRPLAASDLKAIQIHISLLSMPEPIRFDSEEDLLRQLRPGLGVIIEEGDRVGTLLPSVWNSLPDPRFFLQQVKLKAGLAGDYWSSTLKARSYTAEVFSNQSPET